jgi:hypothetical protein
MAPCSTTQATTIGAVNGNLTNAEADIAMLLV